MKTKLVMMMVVFNAVVLTQANANLFTNGGFDTDAAGWTPDPGGHSGHDSGTGNPPGSYLLNSFGEADNDPFVEQTVSGLTPGATYRVSWDLALHVDFGGSSANGLSFGVFLDGNPIHLGEQLTTAFVADSVTFMATNSSHTFRFAGELDPRTPGVAGVTDVSYYIDNITLLAEGECVPPPPGMVSWWPGDGSANDIVGTNHGTLQNGATFAAGKVGQAFSFDGVDDVVVVPHNSILDPRTSSFTVDAWVKTSQTSGEQIIVQKSECYGSCPGQANSAYAIYLANGVLTGWIRDSDAGGPDVNGAHVIEGSGTISDGNWRHVALVRDMAGNALRLYLDGALHASEPLNAGSNGDIKDDDGEPDPLLIGAGMTGGTSIITLVFNGLIDEVEYFNRALSAEEIAAIFNAGSAGKCKPCIPPPSGMVAWWPGDGDANDIVGDAHGALSNGATFAAGKVSEAFSLDGVDDFVSLPDNPAWNFGTGDFTIDFWALSTNSNRRMHALSFEPAYNTRNLNFDFNDPDPPASSQPAVGLWVYWNSTGINQITAGSPGDFTDGQWHHFALTRSGDTFTLYVDGAAVGSANYSDAIDLSNSAVNYIGAGDTGTGAPTHFWDGLIDEVEIFNRALSAEEITAIFNAGSAGKCKPGTPPVLACSLAPAVDTNQVDQTHTVTVTVTTNGSPVQASVSFSVTGANTAGSTGHVTDSNGQAQFTYTGHVAGTDTIRAIATLGGLSTTCTATKVWIHPPAEVHDLAIIRMKAPKNINLKGAEPSLTKRVVVQIQNRSPHDETITNLAELVRVTLTNLQDGEGCAPDAVLIAGPPNQPGRVLKPKQKMNVFFNVTFTGACVPNPLKGAGNEDFRYRAVVNHTALDGNPDTHPTDDECPRAALPGGVDNEAGLNIKDKACPEAKTDVIQK